MTLYRGFCRRTESELLLFLIIFQSDHFGKVTVLNPGIGEVFIKLKLSMNFAKRLCYNGAGEQSG